MSRWFRFYDEAIDDPKILKLSDEAFRAWVGLLCVASKNKGLLPSMTDLGFHLRMKPPRIAVLITQLVAAGLLDKNGDSYSPHNWSARQYKSEDRGKDSYVYVIGAAWDGALKIGFSKNPWARLGDLQSAHHEKLLVLAVFRCKSHSEVELHGVLHDYRKNGEWFSLPSNVYDAIRVAADDKSTYESLVATLRDLLRSATTETETETETETDNRSEKKNSPLCSDDWPKDYGDLFWQAYPRKTEKLSAMKKLAILRKSAIVTFADLMAGVKRYAAATKNTDPKYVKQPTTWLNAGCWTDEIQTGASSGNGTRNTHKTGHDAMFAVLARKAREIAGDGEMAGSADEAAFPFGDGPVESGTQQPGNPTGGNSAGDDWRKSGSGRGIEGEVIAPGETHAGLSGNWRRH